MSSSRKRPRPEIAEDSRAECPFSIRLVDPKEKEQKKKKRRRTEDGEDEGTKKIFPQLSPFTPTGKFRSYETMDVHYQVDPANKWSEMTRYNSFVCESWSSLAAACRPCPSSCFLLTSPLFSPPSSERCQILQRRIHLRCQRVNY